MAAVALDLNLAGPAHAHQLGQAKGVAAIGLVDLASERRLRVACIKPHHWRLLSRSPRLMQACIDDPSRFHKACSVGA